MKSIIPVVTSLQNHLPDDLVNLVFEYADNVFEKPKITYYELTCDKKDIQYIYDTRTNKRITHPIPIHRRSSCECKTQNTFYVCECGRIFNKKYMKHTHDNYFKPITRRKLKKVLKKKLTINNKIHIKNNKIRNENIPDPLTPLQVWNFRVTLYDISKVNIQKYYRHTYQPLIKNKN